MYGDLANNLYMVLYTYRNHLSYQIKDTLMTTDLMQRTRIENPSDLVLGAGMKASISSVAINTMSVGRTLNVSSNGVSVGAMKAVVSVVIDYEAGYQMGGEYEYTSLDDVSNIDTLEGCAAYAKDGRFDFSIAYRKDDDKPFDNWWVKVESDEELLQEILEAGNECDVDESYGELDDCFAYEWDSANRDVAYDLASYLSVHNEHLKNNPISGVEFDTLVRQAMADHLAATF